MEKVEEDKLLKMKLMQKLAMEGRFFVGDLNLMTGDIIESVVNDQKLY